MHAPQAAGTPSLDSVLPLVVLSIAGVSLYIPQPFNPAPSPSGRPLLSGPATIFTRYSPSA